MFPVRYIHAADLHLDAAFRGISREASTADLGSRLRSATFTALERLVKLCEKEKPDFLVIAGDIYNEEDHSLKAQMALRDACERLSRSGIRVFLAHGNHDPLSSRLQTLNWPENTVIFDDSVQSHVVHKDDAVLAVVHGVSHATSRESRNLALAFTRLDTGDAQVRTAFQLGVLHCTVDDMAHSDRYAPCSLDDLKRAGLDAWALGHVHERRTLCEEPFVAYPGNIQGLHINETGSRGCLLITAQPENEGFNTTATFHSLAPVVWENISLSIEGVEQVDTVEQRILESMEKAAAHSDALCETLMVRVRLTGRTTLDGLLRAPESSADLCERIRDTASGRPLVWLKDLSIETAPWLDMEELAQRDDLLGETVRMGKASLHNPQELQQLTDTALAPLFNHARARKVLTTPQEQDLHALLEDAQRLCADLMENR